jgi:peptidoglycan/LPS O-acetylase OafA/YrhL
VRGLAICLVLLYHYFSIGLKFPPGSTAAYAQKLISLSWAGVDLFFVLSGFLIGGILLDHRNSRSFFGVFYLRRAARILPPYLLLVVAWLVLGPGIGLAEQSQKWLFEDCPPVWSVVLFVQNIWMGLVGEHGGNWLGVTWSLAIEEQAYLVLPLLARFLKPRWFILLIVLLILSAPCFRLEAMDHHVLGTYVWPHCRWDGIAFGVLGAWLARRRNFEAWREAIAKRWILILGACLAGGLLMTMLNVSIGSFWMALAGHSWLAASGLFLIFLAINPPEGPVKSILTHPFLVWMGTISYTVYLLHQPVSGLIHGVFRGMAPSVSDLGGVAAVSGALGATLLLAHLSWRFIESPLLSLARRKKYDE